MRSYGGLLVFSVACLCLGCGYNDSMVADENVKEAWGNVESNYQRRADLIPNLVEVVKGSAAHEKDTLTAVTEARASATQVRVDMTKNDPAQIQQFDAAQGQLGASLGRLLVVAEKYPDLKANIAFRDLQVQIEGTENRINDARRRYNQAVANYNKIVKGFPSSWGSGMRGYKERAAFQVTTQSAQYAPQVKF